MKPFLAVIKNSCHELQGLSNQVRVIWTNTSLRQFVSSFCQPVCSLAFISPLLLLFAQQGQPWTQLAAAFMHLSAMADAIVPQLSVGAAELSMVGLALNFA